MKVIGVVGGIASGKSTVVSLMSELTRAYIINADHIGHDLLKKGNLAYHPVLEAFGPQILGDGGEINRTTLGKIVFSNPEDLQKLNQISHPLIYQKVEEMIRRAREDGDYDYIIVDAALLIEIGLINLVDQVWGVYLPMPEQIRRIMLRDALSEQAAIKRIASQLPWEEIKKLIHIKINNAGTIRETKEQIKRFLE